MQSKHARRTGYVGSSCSKKYNGNLTHLFQGSNGCVQGISDAGVNSASATYAPHTIVWAIKHKSNTKSHGVYNNVSYMYTYSLHNKFQIRIQHIFSNNVIRWSQDYKAVDFLVLY